MATVTVSGVVKDETGRKDSRDWKAFSPVYREGSDGEVLTMRKQQVRVVAGMFSAKLDPGVCVLENPDGQRYTVTVPDEDADLWDIISAAVAFPPDTAAEALADAVTTYLEDNPPVADWDALDNKPAVIAEGATVAAARASIGLDAPTILANWKLSNTVKLRSSLAKAKLGTGYSTHVVVGDSLSSAYTGVAFDFPNSWWRRLQRALVADGVPSAGTGRVAITDYAGAPANPTDPRISVSGAWGRYDTAYGSPTAGGSITFTSDVAGTIVDVFYLAAGGPPFTVTIDGTPHTVTPAGGWSRAIDTTTGLTNTTHTVTVTAAPAGAVDSVLLLGFQVRQASGIRFDNFAIKYGIAANNLYNDPGDLGAKALAVDYSSDADVVWIALGANDLATGRTASQIVADITGLRNYWPSADCVLVLEPDTGGAAGHADYVTAMRALAVTLDVPLIDLSLRYGSKAQITAAQLFGADNVHLNTVGQSDWSTVARDGIRSVVGQADGLASVKAMADSAQATADVAQGIGKVAADFGVVDRQQPDHFIQFSRRADASTAPAVADSGLPTFRVNGAASNSQHIVQNGYLTFAPTSGPSAAAYLQSTLPGNATRIGCRFRFNGAGTTTGGAVALVVTKAPVVYSGGITPQSMPMHLVVSKSQLQVGYWDGSDAGGTGWYILKTNPLSLLDNVDYEVEAWLSGNTVTYRLPDGSWDSYTDSNVGTNAGSTVWVENFSNAATTDNAALISKFWASSTPSSPPLNRPFRLVKTYATTGDTTLAANTNTLCANNISKQFLVPASGEVTIRWSAHLKVITAADVYHLIQVVTPSNTVLGSQYGYYAVAGAFEGRRTVEAHITGLVPGTLVQALVYLNSSGSDTHFLTGTSYPATLTVDPVLV